MPCIKKPYPSRRVALRRSINLSIEENKLLWVYRCTCGKWHLTSKRPAKRSYKQKRDGKRLR
jgi:hypothetical protein